MLTRAGATEPKSIKTGLKSFSSKMLCGLMSLCARTGSALCNSLNPKQICNGNNLNSFIAKVYRIKNTEVQVQYGVSGSIFDRSGSRWRKKKTGSGSCSSVTFKERKIAVRLWDMRFWGCPFGCIVTVLRFLCKVRYINQRNISCTYCSTIVYGRREENFYWIIFRYYHFSLFSFLHITYIILIFPLVRVR